MTHRKLAMAIIAIILMPSFARAQKVADFQTFNDSLYVRLERRMGMKSFLKINKVSKSGEKLNFDFDASLGDFPWRDADVKWFKQEMKDLLPKEWKTYSIGNVTIKGNALGGYVTPSLTNDGSAPTGRYGNDDRRSSSPLVRRNDKDWYGKGMSGRHIAIWQSHGYYFEQKSGRWEWQRATLFQTVEDMYTQTYVVPFLVPMLENAGACVLLPRERDWQPAEILVDNAGTWEDAGPGFAIPDGPLPDGKNPFEAGRTVKSKQLRHDAAGAPVMTWKASFPEKGRYAVYISYRTVPGSTTAALYTVHHLGGETSFTVNQTMGGGTWIYLGTFLFDKGEGSVSLDSRIPEGEKFTEGKWVTADAVKFGGGMGTVLKGMGNPGDSCYVAPSVSGMPRFAEGARYWLQFAGYSKSVYDCCKEADNDYKDDYMCRGEWVNALTGGSRFNPDMRGKNIPVDLSLAFHTDAGTHPDSTIVGTLAIYTKLSNGKDEFSDGTKRQTSREYTEMIQSQIVDDIRALYEPTWRRRPCWDRSYYESRVPGVPAMLLELLSHQNYADMKYGLDPTFRFNVSRAIYKGMLKYMSAHYGCPYIVQPLPVKSFCTAFGPAQEGSDSTCVQLSWKAVEDPLEPTAQASSFRIYTRTDDGGFDNGRIADVTRDGQWCKASLNVAPGHIYSFKVTALNEGGESFPSEILAVGIPEHRKGADVLIVNNFTRISGPAFTENPDYCGFDNRLDSGVPYINDAGFIGEMYGWDRSEPWQDDDRPGFGASFSDCAGKVIAGNTFDFTYVHGELIYGLGRAFCSSSADAFTEGKSGDYQTIDLICGKQVSTIIGRGTSGVKYSVFTPQMQEAIRKAASNGTSLLVSGANIATDIWSHVYPIKADKAAREKNISFAQDVLGYKWMTNYASRTADVYPCGNKKTLQLGCGGFHFNNEYSSTIYRVETPDGILPSNKQGETFLRYSDNRISAAISYRGNIGGVSYKTVCIGFPIEVITDKTAAAEIMSHTLEFFDQK